MVLFLLLACGQSPVVSFVSPAPGAEVVAGEPISFTASITDDDALDGFVFTWTADPGGDLDGEQTIAADEVSLLFTRSLPVGAVSVTLRATDPDGHSGSGGVDLSVTQNTAPTVTIVSPAGPVSLGAGIGLPITIQVADPDEPDASALALAWAGADGPSTPNADGTAEAMATFTALGTTSIDVTVTDPAGAVGTASVLVEVYDADDDNDGWPDTADGGTDCDDTDPTISPVADEVCDGVDQDCNGVVDDGPSDGTTWYVDRDGDGYGEDPGYASCAQPDGYVGQGGDCDDYDADVSPGTVEVCDGADQDCDDEVDEGAVDATTWYTDADGDGWGDDTAPTTSACDEPAGTAAAAGDCDDTSAAVNPDEAEICDTGATDEDCDGLADDADPGVTGKATWYRDADGDGYGLAGATRSACDAPAGYVANATDCDDDVAASHPGAVEVCEDGTDGDCDGSEPECTLAGTVDLSAADARWTGESGNDFVGPCDGAGDVDGDGVDDVVVGAWGRAGGGLLSGAVYVVSGGLASGNLSGATGERTGIATSDAAGYAVAGVGDVDGDGYADVFAGGYGDDTGGSGAGAAWLVLGPVTGTSSLSGADATLVGEAASDAAGWAVARAGDTDGDGTLEVMVGAPGADSGGSASGSAYLIEAPSGSVDLSAATARFIGESAGDEAGYAVSPAGDVDADGYDDVLVGGPSGEGTGVVWLVLGPVSGTFDLGSADARLLGQASGDDAGAAAWTAGDTDSDGYADVLVGAPLHDGVGSESGAAYMIHGPVSGDVSLAAADAIFTGAAAQDRAGWSVHGGGDADADGYADMLIGAYYEGSGGTGAGAAYLVYGPASGTIGLGSADAAFIGETARDAAGKNVAFAGDANGDGFDDVLVGAPGQASAAAGAGAVYLVFGGGG